MSAKQGSSGADKGFLARLTAATAFGEGLDGYDLGGISVVLPFIVADLALSSVQEGLIAASTLAGIFFGARSSATSPTGSAVARSSSST